MSCRGLHAFLLAGVLAASLVAGCQAGTDPDIPRTTVPTEPTAPTGQSTSSVSSGTAESTEPPVDPDPDPNGPVIGAPINIPPFTITDVPLTLMQARIAEVVAEACGQDTPCVRIVYEVEPDGVDPDNDPCRIDQVDPPETVERGGTLTVSISCETGEDTTTDETTDETTSAEQTSAGEES